MEHETEWDNCTKCGDSSPLDGAGVCGECANSDLATRLGDVLNTRLRVEASSVLEVVSTWLSDNGLSIIDGSGEIVQL